MARTKAELDLKPCPFCGNKCMWTLNYAEWDSEIGVVNRYKIACCVIQNQGFATRHAAVLAWNKREEATPKKVASSLTQRKK